MMETLKFWATPIVCLLIIGGLLTVAVQDLSEHVRIGIRWVP